MKETYKPIKNYEDCYEISSKGRVKSLHRSIILRPGKSKRGYYCVVLSKYNRQTTKSVHRLVAEAFVPNPLNKPRVINLNGIKTDFSIKNLRWGTRWESEIHTTLMGRKARGEKQGGSKLNENHVRSIRKLHCLYPDMFHSEIADIFNVSPMTISQILRGVIWGHVE